MVKGISLFGFNLVVYGSKNFRSGTGFSLLGRKSRWLGNRKTLIWVGYIGGRRCDGRGLRIWLNFGKCFYWPRNGKWSPTGQEIMDFTMTHVMDDDGRIVPRVVR